jgi:hypothetical protein
VVFRSGAASYKSDSGVGNNPTGYNLPSQAGYTLGVDGVTYSIRAYLLTSATPSSAARVFGFGTNAGNNPAARLRTDGALELVVSGAAQGSPSAVMNDGTWHRVEIQAVATATSNWTSATLLLDGITVATWSGSVARTSNIQWGWWEAPGASKTINIDDIALNDSTGTANTGWCGPGKVVLLVPTADSAVGTGWTRDNAGATGLFNAVDNAPPAGIADTTGGNGLHQIRNATSNANVNYNATMTTYAAAGIAALDGIVALWEFVITGAPVTTSAKAGTFGIVSNPTVANVSLNATGTSGAFWSGFTAGTYGAGWKCSFGARQQFPSVVKGTAPVCRITQVTSSTRIAMCCAIGIYVDYAPGVFQGQEAQDRSDPFSLQVIGQAVNRASVYCLGDKWARKGRLWVPRHDILVPTFT